MSRPPISKPPRSALTAARLRRGWTLKQLADESGVSLPFIGLVEVGQRNASPATWLALARALGCAVGQIRPVPEVETTQGLLFDPDAFLELAGDEHEP